MPDYPTAVTGPWSKHHENDESLPDGIIPTLQQAVTDCNGFVYHGDSLEAQIRLVKWLRHHPREAAALLGGEENG